MTFAHPIEQLVKQRFSCRSYLSQSIEEQTRRKLADYAASLQTGPFGARMRFELVAAREKDQKALKDLGTYGFIKGATGFIIGAIQDDEKNLEDFGYLMERIILLATDIGLGTCWLGGTFTKSSFSERVSPSPGELVPAVAAVGYCSKKPRRLGTFIRNSAGADRRLSWEQLFFDSRFGVPLSRQGAGDYATALEMVRWGPSASNKQPWRVIKDGDIWHFYLQRKPGYRERRLVRLFTVADMQRIDMGIAMCHFELMARDHGLDGRWEINAPDIEKSDELTEYTVSWVG
ncbi:MAG: nitroreductase family protein [Anaerolineales bacterium]|jgi:nitroreductase|nr:nitroreductase family protein [Anaerolineales bacterium]